MTFGVNQYVKTVQLRVAALAVCGALLMVFGCESDPGDEEESGNVIIGDANNYSFVGTLQIPLVQTVSAQDLDICWNEVLEDIQCHGMDPLAEVDNVGMARFRNMSHTEVAARLSAGEMPQSALDGYLEFNTTHVDTCTKLSSLSFFGTPITVAEEYVESAEKVYLLLFANGITPGVGSRMLTFVQPMASSTNTVVNAGSGCGVLDFKANLTALQPLAVPLEGPWIVDWSQMTTDGQGNPIVFETIDGVFLGYYEGVTLEQLQAQMLDMELIATSIWEISLEAGSTANLAYATKSDGSFFQGFSGSGIWILALRCSMCQNPAPLVLTILNPVSGDAQ